MLPLPAPTEITGPLPVAVQAQKAVAPRLPQPPILPEPSVADKPPMPVEDQTVVQIDRDTIPAPAAITYEPQEERRVQKPHPEPPRRLERSATFDKDKEDAEQQQKAARKTWDKKPPTAPRRAKNGDTAGGAAPGMAYGPFAF